MQKTLISARLRYLDSVLDRPRLIWARQAQNQA